MVRGCKKKYAGEAGTSTKLMRAPAPSTPTFSGPPLPLSPPSQPTPPLILQTTSPLHTVQLTTSSTAPPSTAPEISTLML